MNIADVRRWRADEGLSEFTDSNVQRWNSSRGHITQTVRGSHVHITVRLCWLANGFFRVLVVAAGFGTLFVVGSILKAFISGRVHEILANGLAVSGF